MKTGNLLLTILIIIVIVIAVVLISTSSKDTDEINKDITNQEEIVEKENIKIGFIGPLTGDVAAIGQAAKSSVQLAVEEINAKGGIDGRLIEVIYEDAKCSGKEASNAGNKLISVNNVNYIVGSVCSSATLAVAPLAEQAQTVLISPCSSNPSITDAGDFIFRAYPSDLFQGKFAAEYVYNELDARKAAIMASQNDWSEGLKNTFKENFERLGGEITTIQEFPQASSDLRSQLTKVKQTDPDIIYMPAYPESTVNGLKQAKEMGIETSKFLGADTWVDQTIWDQAKGFSEGAMFAAPSSDTPQEFKDKFTQRFEGQEPNLCSVQAYDIINIFAGLIEELGDDPVSVKNELYNVKDYKGVSGMITFDENGDLATAEYDLMIVKDGKQIKK